uniref:Tektin n=1 Tax=Dicentrarchus labrax TaxID=13489 RepID=A0A8C4IZV1_DICLA
ERTLSVQGLVALDDEIVCALGHDLSQIPSATRSTMRNLTSRHKEVSQWQAQISETIGQVDREIIALEQVKSTADSFLEEKLSYGQLMAECVENKKLNTGVLAQDPVLIELKKEVQLTNEITVLLQKQIIILLDKLSSLKEIYAQLLADYQDKGEANKLSTKCITLDINSAGPQLPVSEHKPSLSRDNWTSRCKDIKRTADNLVKDSCSFRGNLRFTLARLKNAHECQHRNTDGAMQKKINEMSKVQERLRWERQNIMYEIKDLTNDTQKVAGQIRNCDSKLHQTNHCLDILNHRPRQELCVDQPFTSLTLEKNDLTKMSSGLRPTLQRCHQDMGPMHHRLSTLEDKMATNAHALDVEQKCHNLHQSFLPLYNPNVPAVLYKTQCQLQLVDGVC